MKAWITTEKKKKLERRESEARNNKLKFKPSALTSASFGSKSHEKSMKNEFPCHL